MKKRTISLILMLAIFVCIFAFAACDNIGGLPSSKTPSGSIQSGDNSGVSDLPSGSLPSGNVPSGGDITGDPSGSNQGGSSGNNNDPTGGNSGGQNNDPITAAKKYEVTYNANGGAFANGSSVYVQKVNENSLLTAPTSPTRQGYSFTGWSRNINGSNTWNFSKDKVTANTTLYANWQANEYTVTLNRNDTSAGSVSGGGKYNYDSNVTISATTTNNNYTWLGWYNSNDTLVTTNTSYTFTMPKENVTYTAKWKKKEFDTSLFIYTTENNTCTITGIKDKTLTEIVVPPTIDGYSVTGIAQGAFSGCSNLESITLPFVGATLDGTSNTHFGYIFGAYDYYDNIDSVPKSLKSVKITGGTSIGEDAFYNCSSLTSIEIPSSVTSIGSKAFYDCSSLTSIEIPSNVTSIGEYAFSVCSKLTNVTFEENSKLESIGQYAFEYCSALTSVTFGENSQLKSIGSSAFSYCSSLTSIEIPSSVTSIGSSAFKYCSALTSIVIPSNLTSIGDGAFYNCLIEEATIPTIAIDYIPKSNLKKVVITSGESIGSNAFSFCSSLTSIVIPSSVTSIGSRAFFNCRSLTSIVIPSSVTSIGWSAFDGCSSLTIYCEVSRKPSGWDSNWNYSNRPVVWNYKK